MQRLIVALAFLASSAGAAADEELNRLPLHLHGPEQKILAICPTHERAILTEEFLDKGGEIEFASEYDPSIEDYSAYYAIISGSNAVDFFRGKDASLFQHIVAWVEDGGHMFFFGAFNGRNFHVAEPFGLTTGYVHNSGFDRVPGRTEALFYGHEAAVPDDRMLKSFGHLRLERPYVRMLNNISIGEAGGWKKLITWPHGHGRVSATMVEPTAQGLWLVPTVADWLRRGAPTTIKDVQDDPAIADPITLKQSRISNGMILTSAELDTTHAAVEKRLAKLDPDKRSDPQFLVEHAESYSVEVTQTYDHWLKRSIHLQLAAKLAAEQVKLDVAFDAVDRAGKFVFVDGPKTKAELLATALKHADKSDAYQITEAALNELPKLQSYYLYDIAQSFASSALTAATLAEDAHLVDLANEQLQQIEQRRTTMLSNAELLDAWREFPDDPEILERVGRLLAYQMNDWELGLDCLARSENIVLSNLARDSINLPEEPTLVIRIGDRWRDIAETRDTTEKANIDEFVREMYRDLGDKLRQASTSDRRRATDFIKASPSPADSVNIRITLDGYGLLTITRDEARWETITGLEPKGIKLGRHTWSDIRKPVSNKGANRFLDPRVDFSTARFGKATGRGVIRFVDRTREKVTLRINDIPRGEDDYEVEVKFGN